MSKRVFHQIYLHLTWHTNQNLPHLCGETERLVYEVLKRKCASISGVRLHAIGGTEDHIHLAVSIEPKVSVSRLVQELKGVTSHEVNTQSSSDPLYWQRGYGVVSFGKNNLPWVMEYIAHQREHHAEEKIYPRLEQRGRDTKTE